VGKYGHDKRGCLHEGRRRVLGPTACPARADATTRSRMDSIPVAPLTATTPIHPPFPPGHPSTGYIFIAPRVRRDHCRISSTSSNANDNNHQQAGKVLGWKNRSPLPTQYGGNASLQSNWTCGSPLREESFVTSFAPRHSGDGHGGWLESITGAGLLACAGLFVPMRCCCAYITG
jgi:hypothetical protein